MISKEQIPQALPALCDAELFQRFLDGDNNSYTVLYHRYSARVMGYVQSLLGADNQATDDIFQETFIRLYRERTRTRKAESAPLRNVGGWLFRVARNLSLNQIRSQNYLTEIPQGYTEQLVTPVDEAYSEFFGQALEEEELLRKVHAVVGSLPLPLREVFVLREVNGMSYEETVEILGCTMEAARMRLSRARSAIRRALSSTADKEKVSE